MLRFSLEVVLKIVRHTDHYGIQSILAAVPELCCYAILVADHKHCPLFFKVDIERRYLPTYLYDRYQTPEREIRTEELFTPSIATQYPIRLFEIYDENKYSVSGSLLSPVQKRYSYSTLRSNIDGNNDNDPKLDHSWINNPGFNNTSFVFVDQSYWITETSHCEVLCTELDRLKGSKWHAGFPIHPPAVGISEMRRDGRGTVKEPCPVYSSHLPSPRTLFEMQLVTLRLEDVPLISYLEFPYLLDLVLIYNNRCTAEAPVIEGLVAPNICRLIIHYAGQVPPFRKMGRLTTRMFTWEKKYPLKRSASSLIRNSPYFRTTRTFELCHIDSIGGFHKRTLDHSTREQVPRKQSDMSFSFLKRFHNVLVSGVPWFVLEEMNLSSVRHLVLTITDMVGNCPKYIDFDLPKLLNLTITIKADDIVLPNFTRSVIHLSHLTVQILGLNPGLASLWDQFKDLPIYMIDIYSDPTLPYQSYRRGVQMYLPTETDKNKIHSMIPRWARSDPHTGSLVDVTLTGFPKCNSQSSM